MVLLYFYDIIEDILLLFDPMMDYLENKKIFKSQERKDMVEFVKKYKIEIKFIIYGLLLYKAIYLYLSKNISHDVTAMYKKIFILVIRLLIIFAVFLSVTDYKY
tara:strand:- start:642 stop:953 length:312 start_codon:yes stop_codon:yes gene_type:complete